MVGLQAMVLGRLGCRPHPRASALSCPSPFAGRGSHTSQAGYGAPALYNACIVGRVVLPPWLHNAAFALRPSALRRSVCGATMTTPGGAGTLRMSFCTFLVLGAPASIIGSELSVCLAPAFILSLAALFSFPFVLARPSLCPTPISPAATKTNRAG